MESLTEDSIINQPFKLAPVKSLIEDNIKC